jgi:hypothetical protein
MVITEDIPKAKIVVVTTEDIPKALAKNDLKEIDTITDVWRKLFLWTDILITVGKTMIILVDTIQTTTRIILVNQSIIIRETRYL